MEVSFEMSFFFIKCSTYNTFPSGGGVADMLMGLSLIKQVIEDVNLMRILFSAKHPQIFWEL